jgi:periplasmic protein TonB
MVVRPSTLTPAARRGASASRWIGRVGSALLLSALAHVAAAISLGAILRSTLRTTEPGETVDVDIAYAPLASEPAREGAAPAVPESPVIPRRLPHPARTPRSQASGGVDLVARRTSVVVSAPDREAMPVRFALSAGTVATATAAGIETSTASSTASRIGSSSAGGPGDGAAVVEGDVSVPARLLTSRPLVYPPAARQAEIEVDLPLEIIVDAAGGVSAARGLTRAGYGLDEAALQAIRGYRFAPALRDGRPVRVKMRWTVQFRLQ